MSQVYVESRGNKYWTNTIVATVLLLVYAAIILYIAVYHPEFFDSSQHSKNNYEQSTIGNQNTSSSAI